ncbi:MAG TPA: membrane protein insertase YidC [Acetobacteraceae bacterium]|nr:membrane protein insertase YidC [Acetobacteraceae bacterium]
MDQQRLLIAIAISVAILLGFQLLVAPHLPQPPKPEPAQVASTNAPSSNASTGNAQSPLTPPQGSPVSNVPAVPKNVPRVKIAAQDLSGSISLLGARLDDLVLTKYRETLAPDSPNVRLLEPLSDPEPYYVQYGWSAAPGAQVKLPDNDTTWASSGDTLSTGHPITLSWDNGEGLTFQIAFSVDDDYMFTVQQSVRNTGGTPVTLYPWSRVRRDYTPETSGYYILFEGMLGIVDNTLQEMTYSSAKSETDKKKSDIAYTAGSSGGWAGFTDKYWLTALIPAQSVPATVNFTHIKENGDHYQVDYLAKQPETIAPHGDALLESHLFAGAKIVSLLQSYQSRLQIPRFDYAVDWGYFWFLTQPIFTAIDWLNGVLGNFGLAIMAFTLGVKLLFFPLANYSYRSMSKMRLLGPRMQQMRERFKDEPQRMQQEMMAMYRAEKVNPASGCLPMVVQIPVFFSLYKVIFVTIEMRQAPFFGWIHDLSQVDPTNVFNLFGLIPFDPSTISPFLHMGAWPLIMGLTMFLQQRLNPPPPDPVQARMFQFMPLIFTFMMARFPAGLIIYWSWNNLLSIAQQWVIMRRTHLSRPGLART